MTRNIQRRTFLKGAGTVGAGVGGLATIGAKVGRAGGKSRDPSVAFPSPQTALTLPDNPAPMEAAVQTKDVHMPEGGWVVISLRGQTVGRSMNKLPAGHFQSLKVATKALSGTHTLGATIVHGDSLESARPYMDNENAVSDTATVSYP